MEKGNSIDNGFRTKQHVFHVKNNEQREEFKRSQKPSMHRHRKLYGKLIMSDIMNKSPDEKNCTVLQRRL